MSGLWDFERSVQCCGDYDCPNGYSCSGYSCVKDVAIICGDGRCSDGETSYNCPYDCGMLPCTGCESSVVCGDGYCDFSRGESCSSCPYDCGSCAPKNYCGDGICDLNTESQYTCPQDCGDPISHEVTMIAADDCMEIVRGNNGEYQILLTNRGDATETLSIIISGEAASWTSVAESQVTLLPEQSRDLDVFVHVPSGQSPGLYTLNVKARNSNLEVTDELKVDVKLLDLQTSVNATETGSENEGNNTQSGVILSPTGAVIGGIEIPILWIAVVLVVACALLGAYIITKKSPKSMPAAEVTYKKYVSSHNVTGK